MRILHVISTLKMGGAEHLMVDLLPILRSMGNDVELLLIDGTKTAFFDELDSCGIKINFLQQGGNVYNPINIFRMKKVIRGYDIVHTHTFPCQLFAAFIHDKKAKLVTTEHSTTNHRRNKWWLKLLDKWMYHQYNTVICISEKANRNLKTYLGTNDNIETINNGIDCQKYVSHINQYLGEKIVITMVASMRDAKDQDTVIRAMPLLGNRYKLKLVGDGPRRHILENLVTETECKNKVIFCGNQTDIPQILSDSDIVVLSSHWEGFGLSAVEAMAAGRPLIASDVDGLHEIVDGAGILFPHGDHKTLAKAIQELCDNPKHYKQVAQRCQERAKQFDISIMAEKYNNLYQRLKA